MAPVTTLEDLGDIHRMTVDDYLRIAELDPALERTELIEGVVHDVSPEHALHLLTVEIFRGKLAARFPDDWVVASGSARFTDWTLFDPDVFVFPRSAITDWYRPIDGTAVRLAVEVSVTTWRHDSGAKLRAYATAGVPRLWIVRPDRGVLLHCTDPAGDGYRSRREVSLPTPENLEAQLDIGPLLND
jgi:Uma2 family endonuclease